MAKNGQKLVKMGKNGPKIGQYPDRLYEPGHIAYLITDHQFQPALFIGFTTFDAENWPIMAKKGHKWPELVNKHTDHSNMGM